ncbi:MAG: tetratricopeptide repeat protein [Pseudomonadales bacterium]
MSQRRISSVPLLAQLCLLACLKSWAGDGLPAEAAAHGYLNHDPPRWDLARDAFTQAASAGSPTAMAHLGWIHEHGHGGAVSHPLAAHWYAKAYHAGARHLALKLGWLYLGGDEAIRDRTVAESWFRHAIEAGDLPAHVALASVLVADAQGGIAPARVHEARELLQTALAGELLIASYFLARIYLEGIGTQSVDYAKALPYIRLGAEHGHPQMQGWLARMYADGQGVAVDPLESAKWSLLAAAGGDPLGRQLERRHRAALSTQMLAEAQRRALAWAEQS